MAKVIKVKAGERLDEASVKEVIKALGAEAPISKKEACAMLNITYNTTRLTNIIKEYEDKIAFRRRQRAAVRKTPVSILDKKNIVQSFVSGVSVNDIVKDSFRSLHIVNKVLVEFNMPARTSLGDRILIEEEQTAEDYGKGDLVYSAKYGEYAEIIKKHSDSEEHGAIYHIYILGKHCMNAYQPYYELIDLRKAQDELDISVTSLSGIPARNLPRGK